VTAKLDDAVARLSESVWALGAVCAALDSGLAAALAEPAGVPDLARRTGLSVELAGRLLDVLEALGLASRDGGSWEGAELAAALGPRERFVRANARNAPLQVGELAARAASGRLETGWWHTDALILETQGVMSAAAVEPLANFVFPSLDGLPERLAAPGAAFLDVGAGVGEVGLELCRRYDQLTVVGLEPAAAPRELALARIAAAGLADRVSVRDQRVEQLGDEEGFDVAWLPLPFLPAEIAEPAVRAVHRALRPGGWLLAATLGSPARGELGDTLAAFRSVLWGGGPLAPDAVEELLAAAGFTDIAALPRTPARLTPLRARRP